MGGRDSEARHPFLVLDNMRSCEKEIDSGDNASTAMGVSAQIDKESERRVLSKFDWFVMPQMSILVLFAYLDRTNIGM